MTNRLSIRYEVTTYCGPGSDIETRTWREDEIGAARIDELLKTGCIDVDLAKKSEPQGVRTASATLAKPFDYLLGLAWGKYGFRDPSGEWIPRDIDGSGLGRMGLRIIQAAQLHPGVFLTPQEISDLVSNWNLLNHNVLAARLKAVRAAHDESGEHPRLFLTRRNGGYALMWPAEFSWIWIDRIVKPAE